MANVQNLKPQAHVLTVEELSRGGRRSGKRRRDKKMLNDLISQYIEQGVANSPKMESLAVKAGLESNKSIKELIVAICLLNTIKNGRISDLQRLAQLLGEDSKSNDIIEALDNVLESIDEIMENN